MRRLKRILMAHLPESLLRRLGVNLFQGFVDERSPIHVAGWVRNLARPDERVQVEVRLRDRVILRDVAEEPSAILSQLQIGDGRYAFYIVLDEPVPNPALLSVRASGGRKPLPLAADLRTIFDPVSPVAHAVLRQEHLQGYVDERSTRHVAGWARDLRRPGRRLEIEVVLTEADGERVLASGVANRRSAILEELQIGDGGSAFFIDWPEPLTEGQRDRVVVRVFATRHVLDLAPALATNFDRNSPVLRAIGV